MSRKNHPIFLTVKGYWFIVWIVMGMSLHAQQSYDLHVSGNYGIPRYDSFFDLGFESRLGGTIRWRTNSTDRLKVGAALSYQRFRPILDNPTDVVDARLFALNFGAAYDLVPQSANALEVVLETGYSFLTYNSGGYSGGGLALSPGIQYLLMVEEVYGVEFGLFLRNIFDRFGGVLNPSQSGLMQFVELKLGITVPVSK